MNKIDINDVILGESEEYQTLDSAEEILITNDEPLPIGENEKNIHELNINHVEFFNIERPPIQEFKKDPKKYDKIAVQRTMKDDRINSVNDVPLKTETEEIASNLKIQGIEYFDIERPEVEPFERDLKEYNKKPIKRLDIDKSFVEVMSRLDVKEEEIDINEVICDFGDFQEERYNIFMNELKKNIASQKFYSEKRMGIFEQSKRIKNMAEFVSKNVTKSIENNKKHLIIDVQIENNGNIICNILDDSSTKAHREL